MDVKNQNLVEKICKELSHRILNNEDADKVFYTEGSIVKEFEVSKATARQALHKMCYYGYMKSYPRKGYLLVAYSPTDLKKIQRLRYALEALAVKLIILNCSSKEIETLYDILEKDPYRKGNEAVADNSYNIFIENTANVKFHVRLGELSGDENLRHLIEMYAINATRTAQDYDKSILNTEDCSHEALVYAIEERNTNKALEILRKHLNVNEKGM